MNNRSLRVLKDIYKPYRYTISGRAHILESTSGNVVVKEKEKDLRSLYQYLESRGFSSYPALLDDSREGVNVFEYVPDTKMPIEQKAMDFMKVVALLHQKTTYYREVSEDDFKQIYDNILGQIDYLRYFYTDLYERYFKSVYPSPSEYLLLRNLSKIFSSLDFSAHELEDWYRTVQNLSKYRVCQIHNHLCLEHYHKCNKDCLLSWEKSRQDTPVLDLLNFYHCAYFDLNFEVLLQEYSRICPWSEEEKKLFFLVISLPLKFEEKGTEFERVKKIREVLDYVYKTENLIRPYYSIQKEQK